jgi:plastocyanin
MLPGEAAASSAASVNWKLTVGAQAQNQGIQANSFYPRDVSIHVGDTITWTVRTGEIHTVTFLSGQPAPPLIINGGLNPVVAEPTPPGIVDDGKGFFNSGLLQTPTSDNPTPTTTYTLGFGATGDFPYVCLIHSQMKGTVHVEPAGIPVPPQAEVTGRGLAEAGQLLGQGALLEGQGLISALLAGDHVTAGIGKLIPNTATLAILRFLPQHQVVRAGDTVTWTNLDPETPHTVTFGLEPASAVVPSGNGIDGKGHATLSKPGDTANSGYLGAAFPFGTQFQVKFNTPGTYPYICALHDDLGMIGTVEVVR